MLWQGKKTLCKSEDALQQFKDKIVVLHGV
jgi:hypothetical protein